MTTINNNILTTSQYQQNNLMAPADNDMLGRDAFLRLLTTQLQNQDPLSPMENEAFVAQLAQFSSVEGIKGMQASLETMVGSMVATSYWPVPTSLVAMLDWARRAYKRLAEFRHKSISNSAKPPTM